MLHRLAGLFAAALLLAGTAFVPAAVAQEPKRGGILKIYHRDNPPSASMHEEATNSVTVPFMAIYNNLVMYDPNVPQNSMQSIVPDLATAWKWSADNTALTFTLRPGVKWHDGKPFTARDVKCTFDMLLEKTEDRFRKNPRQSWYTNLADVVVDSEFQVTFKLNRPQPSLLAMLASGYTPVYACHVTAATMRTRPIGTGPFKFVEWKANEIIRLTRNTDYWKPGRPYLDGIEMPIIPSRATAVLAFIAGRVDMTFPTEVTQAIRKDIAAQAPAAQCHIGPTNVSTNLIVNRDRPPFDNADLRRAMALALDRKAYIDIISEGQNDVGATMLPAPAGVWAMPAEMLRTLVGYDADLAKNRAQARAIMERLGYGPNKRLAVKVSTRNIAPFRDPAVILIDHLKEIYIDGELEIVETGVWVAKVARKDYAVGLNLTGNGIDDPDQAFYENYSCKSERNLTGYCNPALEKKFDEQSVEFDFEKRRAMVWEIDRLLTNDVARPIIMHNQGGGCWHPDVRGLVFMANSIYNGFRMEDVWLNR